MSPELSKCPPNVQFKSLKTGNKSSKTMLSVSNTCIQGATQAKSQSNSSSDLSVNITGSDQAFEI